MQLSINSWQKWSVSTEAWLIVFKLLYSLQWVETAWTEFGCDSKCKAPLILWHKIKLQKSVLQFYKRLLFPPITRGQDQNMSHTMKDITVSGLFHWVCQVSHTKRFLSVTSVLPYSETAFTYITPQFSVTVIWWRLGEIEFAHDIHKQLCWTKWQTLIWYCLT